MTQDLTLKNEKHLAVLAVIFVSVLLISNTVATKIFQLGPFIFSGAIIIFPISYIFGDILTEVYGYKTSKKLFGLVLLDW